jgi:hypothetical protein
MPNFVIFWGGFGLGKGEFGKFGRDLTSPQPSPHGEGDWKIEAKKPHPNPLHMKRETGRLKRISLTPTLSTWRRIL